MQRSEVWLASSHLLQGDNQLSENRGRGPCRHGRHSQGRHSLLPAIYRLPLASLVPRPQEAHEK